MTPAAEVSVDVYNGQKLTSTVLAKMSVRKGSEAKEVIVLVGIQSGPTLRFVYVRN